MSDTIVSPNRPLRQPPSPVPHRPYFLLSMSLSRHLLLRASRSPWLARQLSERAFFRRAVQRFMPGEDLGAALAAAAELVRGGIGGVLTQLGEQVISRYEAPDVAFPKKRDVDAAYAVLAGRLLERAAQGQARAVFGTHDVGLIARLRERALAVGAAPGAYEVHMLYGIRAAEQRALQSEGVPVRVLISYGTHWFPWYMRRLAERPANVWFVVRNLV